MSLLKKNYKKSFKYDFLDKVLKNIDKDCRILDVGCGYGQILKYLNNKGYRVDGVEKNISIVNEVRNNGYNIYTTEEFTNPEKRYDLLILSHIIEHFQYVDLKDFLELYLKSLKDGGFVLIYTPTLNEDFFVDFDHVKPYHPFGIKMVFGSKDTQVQFYSKYSLELVEFDYRRVPLNISYSRLQMLGKKNYFAILYNVIFGILCRISFKIISRKTGWAGLFKLQKSEA